MFDGDNCDGPAGVNCRRAGSNSTHYYTWFFSPALDNRPFRWPLDWLIAGWQTRQGQLAVLIGFGRSYTIGSALLKLAATGDTRNERAT